VFGIRGGWRVYTTCTLSIGRHANDAVGLADVCFAWLAPKEARWICVETAPKDSPMHAHVIAIF